jgi:hypothetical protein
MYGIALIATLTAVCTITPVANKKSLVFTPTEKIITHQLGDKNIQLKLMQYGTVAGTCCINLHDDESTAVQAAQAVLQQRGGLLIKIENKAQRLISFPFKGIVHTFDPNRIFSAKGIALTLKAKGKVHPQAAAAVAQFAARILQLIPDSAACIVALHNNTDGDFSINTYQPGGKRHTDACQVYADSWQDIDDITLTTDSTLFDKMAGFGYNSVLQDNVRVVQDGSLSVYYGLQNRRYINIETQHGKTLQYKEMLGKLISFLEQEKEQVLTTGD